jgi:ssDNA-specific exonuclease RecJ
MMHVLEVFHSMNKDEYVDGLPSMEKFMKIEKTLMDKYEDVIVSLRLLDLEDDNNRLLVHFISCYLHFSIIFFFNFDVHVCQS